MLEVVKWIAVDWGSSNLRVWAIDGQNQIIAQRSSHAGMGGLSPSDFEPALLSLIEDLLPADVVTQVLICGMAGAKQGWIEAPYAAVPCPPSGTKGTLAPTKDKRLKVNILPGLCQGDPFDVMRGEETQISGFLSLNDDFDGVLCLPGTHTKWVKVSQGEVSTFQTAMTGEMFALLSKQSVLRHFMPDEGQGDWDQEAFLSGVDVAKSHSAGLLSQLFAIRASGLLSDRTPAQSRAHLSGLLIGSELQSIIHYWLGKDVRIIGAPALCELYQSGLTHLGARVAIADYDDDLSLVGLKAAYAKLA